MATEVIRGGAGALGGRSPRERALAGLASLMSEAPWTLRRDDLDRLRAVGLSEEGLVQAVTIGGIFNYVTRVADGIGLDFDYESPLPRMEIDASLEPLPRPERSAWPALDPRPAATLHLRPASEAVFARWQGYAFDREGQLDRRDRAVLRRATAFAVCDEAAVIEVEGASPASPREITLAAYATKLTLTPWRMTEADLAPLRAEGLDDAGILDVVSVVALQNTLSRIRLALGAPG
jgi:alkylhydroperoxidase family enzyme